MVFLDLTDVKEWTGGFDPIPSGWYPLVIDDAMMKQTKDGTGEYINVTFKIFEGSYMNRRIFHMFHLVNKNKEFQVKELGKLRLFLGLAGHGPVLNMLNDLPGLKVMGQVKTESSEEYGDKNVVKAFKEYKADPNADNLPNFG